MKKKLKTVFVSGHFNVLHPGHIRLFQFARTCGNKLIVAVESDRIAGSSAHIPEKFRLDGVKMNSLVDEAFLFDEPIFNLISRLKPDIVVKGKEHEYKQNPEKEALDLYGGKLIYSSGDIKFSSIDLIRKEFSENSQINISLPFAFMERHKINQQRLIDLINQFSKLKVCIIGDLILDEYITCDPLGMSQEDPTIVVTPVDIKRFVGGAGIVSAHVAGLGANSHFISVSGIDSMRNFAISTLQSHGVNIHLLEDPIRPTTLKQRFRSQGKSLLRVSHLNQHSISIELQDKIMEIIENLIPGFDLLVFSDFNYGVLPQPLVNKITQYALNKGVMTAADSQSSSQTGDVARFLGVDLLTPTEREARISTKNREDGIVVLTEQLRQQSQAKNILLKMGGNGLLIHPKNPGDSNWVTDQVEALNRLPKDVAGAGDSLLIGSALTLAAKGDIWEAAIIGSLAAAIQVSRVGNIPITSQELLNLINSD